jgi:Tfp pilus assembly protein PilN
VINLMPPELKQQIRYAKYNRLGLRYLRVTLAVVVVLGVVFAGALYLLHQQEATVANDVTKKQAEIKRVSNDFLPKAKDASERLTDIKYIQDTQTRYSAVMADLVKVLPREVDIETLLLTGDETRPVGLSVTAKTYDEVLALRNALVTSPRIGGADIVSAAQTKDGWAANLLVGYRKGMGSR